MTLASTAADITVTSGAQAAQLLTGATNVAFVQPGEVVTIALTNTSGAFEWQLQPAPGSSDNFGISTGIYGELFGKKYYSPSSSTVATFTAPQVPCTLNFFSEATDGHNVLRSLWTIQVRQAEANIGITSQVRGVEPNNVASLTAYAVAGTDLTFVQGDRILLAGQTTGTQNGIYEVGVVSGGNAPLTRAGDMAVGATLRGPVTVRVAEGTTFANTEWFLANTGVVTIGTTSLVQAATTGFYPRCVQGSGSMGAGAPTGTFTINTVPIRTLTHVNVALTRHVATTPSATIMYCTTSAGAEGITVGKVGTAAVVVQAVVAAGTINTADGSLINWTLNQS